MLPPAPTEDSRIATTQDKVAPAEGAARGTQADAPANEVPDQILEVEVSQVTIRSAVLPMILFLLVMYTLYFAASLLIPIALAFLLSLVLSPMVHMLTSVRLPRPLAALLVMLSFAALLVAIVYAIAQPAISWMERAPTELQKLEYKLAWVKEPIAELERARQQVDRLTNVGDQPAAEPPPPRENSFSLVQTVLLATPTLAFGIAVTLILLFFILASGDALLNKAVQVSPTLQDKKRVVEAGRGIQHHVSTYLGTITVINVFVGIAVGIAMYLLNVPNPALWGVMMAILNFIPYIGVMISMIIVTFVGLMTFEEPLSALLPPAAIFAINVVEGQFLTPIIAGRRLSLSPLAVFLSLVVMGWVWGILGVLMAVPLLAIVKLVCEEIESLHWVATFLGTD